MINPIKRLRKENQMFMSINAGKVVKKIQYKPMIKFLKKLGIEGNVFKNPIANIILYDEC